MENNIEKVKQYGTQLFMKFVGWQLANNARNHDKFTLVFFDETASLGIEKEIRDTDILFSNPEEHQMILLMPNIGESEAEVFLNRLFSKDMFESREMTAAVIEVRNSKTSPIDLLTVGDRLLKQALNMTSRPTYLADHSFTKMALQHVRISIIDEDAVVTTVIRNLVERLAVSEIEFEIKEFHDGQSFLESDWYLTQHTHLVIMNDVLPKKNGLDVLHALRALPNTKRFHIFMMTKRHSEREMIYAYENGVDEYMTKPFNPRLLEAQIKKVMNRLYHE